MSFYHLTKGITPKICMLSFVLINSVLFWTFYLFGSCSKICMLSFVLINSVLFWTFYLFGSCSKICMLSFVLINSVLFWTFYLFGSCSKICMLSFVLINSVLFWTFYLFGSCYRTLALILVSDFYGYKREFSVSVSVLPHQRQRASGCMYSFLQPAFSVLLFAADIVFIVKDKPHPRFRREGLNLIHTANVALGRALTGTTVDIHTLDERILHIPINDIIKWVLANIVVMFSF